MEIKENEKYYFEKSLFVELSTKTDLLYLFSDLYNENDIKKELKDIIKKMFLLNGFKISETLIKKYFNDFLTFIVVNLKENIIKSSNDLKFYIENEILLIIENDNYLFNRFFKNEYKEIKNFLFVEIE